MLEILLKFLVTPLPPSETVLLSPGNCLTEWRKEVSWLHGVEERNRYLNGLSNNSVFCPSSTSVKYLVYQSLNIVWVLCANKIASQLSPLLGLDSIFLGLLSQLLTPHPCIFSFPKCYCRGSSPFTLVS